MELLAPAWLLAAIAVGIPLLYHLRRNTPPEVIQVGSVAHLSTGAARANRRRPRNLVLLLVRCALLVLVAVALAQPLTGHARAGRRIVVAPAGEWSAVDSLARTGALVLAHSTSRYPWSAALEAHDHTTAADTLLLIAPEDAARWIGPRPSLTRVSIVVSAPGTDPGSPGPPMHQLTPSRDVVDSSVPRHRAAPVLWWVVLALAPLERLLARRSSDAG